MPALISGNDRPQLHKLISAGVAAVTPIIADIQATVAGVRTKLTMISTQLATIRSDLTTVCAQLRWRVTITPIPAIITHVGFQVAAV